MMKILTFFLLVFSFTAIAKMDCTFIRHHHVQIEGKDLPKELRNKILNDFNPDKVIIQKVNEVLGINLCATFKPFHHLKDILAISKPKEEQVLTKVTLSPDKNGFWLMTTENFMRKDEKEVTAVTGIESYTSAKSIKEIKNSEVVEWVSTKLLIITTK